MSERSRGLLNVANRFGDTKIVGDPLNVLRMSDEFNAFKEVLRMLGKNKDLFPVPVHGDLTKMHDRKLFESILARYELPEIDSRDRDTIIELYYYMYGGGK